MNIYFERPNACRLYSALGHTLWLHGVVNSDLTPEEKLEAVEHWSKNMETEVGIRRLNFMQDEVYCTLVQHQRTH